MSTRGIKPQIFLYLIVMFSKAVKNKHQLLEFLLFLILLAAWMFFNSSLLEQEWVLPLQYENSDPRQSFIYQCWRNLTYKLLDEVLIVPLLSGSWTGMLFTANEDPKMNTFYIPVSTETFIFSYTSHIYIYSTPKNDSCCSFSHSFPIQGHL